eukprot:Gb_01337 [translate_table: standard]
MCVHAFALMVPCKLRPTKILMQSLKEKKIAFIGVKVYAIGFYVDAAIRSSLAAWNGKLGSQIEQDSIFFKAVSEAPVEKSLQIVLVRDIDGETFWSALDEALSPRLKFMGAAEQKALAIFQETFKGRPLKQGTIINLTWLQPSIMLAALPRRLCLLKHEQLIQVKYGLRPIL